MGGRKGLLVEALAVGGVLAAHARSAIPACRAHLDPRCLVIASSIDGHSGRAMTTGIADLSEARRGQERKCRSKQPTTPMCYAAPPAHYSPRKTNPDQPYWLLLRCESHNRPD